MRKNRVPKPDSRKLSELEDHLHILRTEVELLQKDTSHLMVIAAALRSLVCYSSGTEGLLWRLCNRFDVSDEVVVYTAGNVNPDAPLARGLRLFVLPLQRPTESQGQRESLEWIIKKYDAIFAAGSSYTYEDLIKTISQQIGIAHSDPGIEPRLSMVEQLLINGLPPYFTVISNLAEFVLQVGNRVIDAAVDESYKRTKRSASLTISIGGLVQEIPAGRVKVAEWRSDISEVSVKAYFTPRSFEFIVDKRGKHRWCPNVMLPDGFTSGRAAFFGLTYDSSSDELRAIAPQVPGPTVKASELGYLHPREIVPVKVTEESMPYMEPLGLPIHARLLSPQEMNQMPEVVRYPPTFVDDCSK